MAIDTSKNDKYKILNWKNSKYEIADINKQIIIGFIEYMKKQYNVDYLNDDNYIGMMFYGSRLVGTSTPISDLDLCIVSKDGTSLNYKGVVEIDGIEVEYVEKEKQVLIDTIIKDYNTKNDFPKSAYGRAANILDKNGVINEVKELVNELYSNIQEENNTIDPLSIFSSSIDLLKRIEYLANINNPYVNVLYYKLLDKIKSSFHTVSGYKRLEIYKAIHSYLDKFYKESLDFYGDYDEGYIEKFITALSAKGSIQERIIFLKELMQYIIDKYNITEEEEYKTQSVKHHPYYFSEPIIFDETKEATRISIDNDIKEKLLAKEEYKNNPDFIGFIAYRSTKNNLDEFELIALYNSNNEKIYKGAFKLDDLVIKYYEIPYELYKKDNYLHRINSLGFLIPSNSFYDVFANNSENEEILNEYAVTLLDKNKKVESLNYDGELIVIENRLNRLKTFINEKDVNYFDMYVSIILEKSINAYRNLVGSTYIDPSNEENAKFLKYYNGIVDSTNLTRTERYELACQLFEFLKGDRVFEKKERIDTNHSVKTIKQMLK